MPSPAEVSSYKLNSLQSLNAQIFTETGHQPKQGIGYLMTRDIENQGHPSELMELLQQTTERIPYQDFALAAADFAIELFQDKKRKDGLGENGNGTPYDRHLLRTALRIQKKTALNIAIAMLHDAREDIPELTKDIFQTKLTAFVEERSAKSGSKIPPDTLTELIEDTFEATGYLSDNNGWGDSEKIRKSKDEFYGRMFEMDKKRPEFCLLEIKTADREDNMISDIGMILNGKEKEDTRKNLKNAIKKAQEFYSYLITFRPEKPSLAASLFGVISEAQKALYEPKIIFTLHETK